MKSPEQIARDMLDEHVRGVRSDITDAALIVWMTRAIEGDRAQIRAILDMDDEEVGDYNEWGDVQRVFMLREALGMDGDA